MTQDDNVVKLPDLLERRAIKIEAALIARLRTKPMDRGCYRISDRADRGANRA